MLQKQMNIIQKNLYQRSVVPNYGSIHCIKVIAGAGYHTAGGKDNAVLKNMVYDFLEYGDYDFLSNLENGVFLITLKI